jgi:hypothetical protein
MFEEAWQEVIQQIINQFSIGNSALALEAAEPFLFDEKYEQEFASLAKKQKEPVRQAGGHSGAKPWHRPQDG